MKLFQNISVYSKYMVEYMKPSNIVASIAQRFTHTPTQLGRWNRESRKDTMDVKIDLNNYDHCGTCGFEKYANINKESER